MNDPDLDRLLHTWAAPEAPADDFRRGVWQRIATQNDSAAAPRWCGWLDALVRPRLAFSTIIVALVAGTVAGSAHAAFKLKEAPVTMTDSTAAYMQSINPLDPGHRPHAGDRR